MDCTEEKAIAELRRKYPAFEAMHRAEQEQELRARDAAFKKFQDSLSEPSVVEPIKTEPTTNDRAQEAQMMTERLNIVTDLLAKRKQQAAESEFFAERVGDLSVPETSYGDE